MKILLFIFTLASSCKQPSSSQQSRERNKAELNSIAGKQKEEQQEAKKREEYDHSGSGILYTGDTDTETESQISLFEDAYPEVTDRFFIGSGNSVFYDFKREDGTWDMEENGKALESEGTDINYESDEVPNVLFPAHQQIRQFQPARRQDGTLVVFFIDKDKTLFVMEQIIRQKDYWVEAKKLDQNIESVFPIKNSQNQITIIYSKNQDDQQVMLRRTFIDEAGLLTSRPEVDHTYRDPADTSAIIKTAGEVMKKDGIVIASMKQIDNSVTDAIIAGKNGETSEGANLRLTDVGDGYKDGAIEDAWTRDGSFGASITKKEGWNSPHDICSNIATALVLAPVVATGPVGAVMTLGLASGLQRPEDMQRLAENAAAEGLDYEAYLEFKEYLANQDPTEDDLAVDISDESEFVELTEDEIGEIQAACSAFNKSLEEQEEDKEYPEESAESQISDFCLQLDLLIGIRNDGADFTGVSPDGEMLGLGPEALGAGILVHTAAKAAWATNKTNALYGGLTFLLGGVALVFAPGVVMVPLLIGAAFKSFHVLTSDRSLRFFSATKAAIFGVLNGSTFADGFLNRKIASLQTTIDSLPDDDPRKQKLKNLQAEYEKQKAIREYLIADRDVNHYEEKQKKLQDDLDRINQDIDAEKDQKKREQLDKERTKISEKLDRTKSKNQAAQGRRQAAAQKSGLDVDKLKNLRALIWENVKAKFSNFRAWVGARAQSAWVAAKNFSKEPFKRMYRGVVSSLKGYVSFVGNTARKSWGKSGRRAQGGLLISSVVGGGVATYGQQDDDTSTGDKWKGAAEGGANTVVESPIAAVEGLNNPHLKM